MTAIRLRSLLSCCVVASSLGLIGCGDDDTAEPPAAHGGGAGNPSKSDGSSDAEDAKSEIDWNGDVRGKCDLNSGYPGDEACIPAPPAEMGMQIHVGPTNYDDADEVAKFILKPGQEVSECWTFRTPNDEAIYYQTSALSGRPGTHHIIDTMYEGEIPEGGFTKCADGSGRSGGSVKSIGALPGASKPYMPRDVVAPEYAHVGAMIPAHALAQADMHYFNFTDHDIVREFWLNVYYVDPSEVHETGRQIAALGGFSWNNNPIPPNTDQVYRYSCPIKGDGYIMSLLGHYHAHGKRFTAYLERAGSDPAKVFEMYDYQDPAMFQYNSVVENPLFSDAAPGAISGQLAVRDGDMLTWECHIVNDSDVALRYVNEVQTGEMCNLWGTSVGITPISCFMP